MLPLRHDLQSIGGSWAQRQIFNCTAIEAAIRAGDISVATGLVAELSARKPQNGRLKALLDKLKTEALASNTEQPPSKKAKLS